MRWRIALGSWSNAHFDHGLYPLGSPRADRLARFAALFDAVEVDRLRHEDVQEEQLAAWAADVPASFRFLPKLHRSVTHGARDEAALEAAAAFDARYDAFGDTRGPTLIQFPATFGWSDDAATWLEALLDVVRDPAMEFRHPSWLRPEVENLLRRRGAILVWGTYPKARAPAWTTCDQGYVRLAGTAWKSRGRWVQDRDATADLLSLREALHDAAWGEACLVVTNRFEGNALDSLARAVAALVGPERARAFVPAPGAPLLP